MKIALYIEDGLEQIVLTPDTKTERSILGKLSDQDRELKIEQGSFYGCRGGWVRHRETYDNTFVGRQDDESTIIVLRKRELATNEMEPDIPPELEG